MQNTTPHHTLTHFAARLHVAPLGHGTLVHPSRRNVNILGLRTESLELKSAFIKKIVGHIEEAF